MRLTPRRWAGNGLLGAYVRYVSYLGSHDDVLQVIDVLSHSPAALAGLVPDLDFILGADDAVFESVDEFGAFLADRCVARVHFRMCRNEPSSSIGLCLCSSRWVVWAGKAHRCC